MKLKNPFTKKKKEVLSITETVTIQTKPAESFVTAEYSLDFTEAELIEIFRAKYGIEDDFELKVYVMPPQFTMHAHMFGNEPPKLGWIRATQKVKLTKD